MFKIEDIASLPEDKVMSALFSTEFPIEEKDSDIEQSFFVKKNNYKVKTNRKYIASQKYKIKDKRILFKGINSFDYKSQSDIVKHPSVFYSDSVVETKYSSFELIEQSILCKPFLATFQIKEPLSIENVYSYGTMYNLLMKAYFSHNYTYRRLVYFSFENGVSVLKDFYHKKSYPEITNLIKIKDFPFMNFEENAFVNNNIEKTSVTIPFNAKNYFYGKPLQRNSFCQNVYLYGFYGRGQGYYEEYKMKKEKAFKKMFQQEIKEICS